MNKRWISDSHKSAEFFRHGQYKHNINMRIIRILDATGMFETSWLVYDHAHTTKYGYGCPK